MAALCRHSAADHALRHRCCAGTGLGLQGARTTFLQGAWHVATTPFRVLGYARDTASGVAQSAIEYTLHKANSYAQVRPRRLLMHASLTPS